MPTRSLLVRREHHGQSLAALVRQHLNLSWTAARRLIETRKVVLGGKVCVDPDRRVSAGQRIEIKEAKELAQTQKPAGDQPILRHVDEHILVVEKPAGLTTMRHPEEAAEFGKRAQRFLPPTLAELLPALLAKEGHKGRGVISVHRIDKETSGLVVFARTEAAAKHLGQQFRDHSIDRRYLALVRGQVKEGRIESWLVRDRGDGRRGSGDRSEEGQLAVTQVKLVEPLGEFSLVECELETGRTHQVRIHLAEAGTPLCGEQVYDRPLHGKPIPDGSGAQRVALHAAFLALDHPVTGKRMQWTSALPQDLARLLSRLRSQVEGEEEE